MDAWLALDPEMQLKLPGRKRLPGTVSIGPYMMYYMCTDRSSYIYLQAPECRDLLVHVGATCRSSYM